MPTYEYECEACSHHFEELQSMTDKKLEKCPKCGKNELIRLIGTGSGVIFKGTGFYETDYKKKDAPKSEASKPETPKKSESPSCSTCPHGGCSTS